MRLKVLAPFALKSFGLFFSILGVLALQSEQWLGAIQFEPLVPLAFLLSVALGDGRLKRRVFYGAVGLFTVFVFLALVSRLEVFPFPAHWDGGNHIALIRYLDLYGTTQAAEVLRLNVLGANLVGYPTGFHSAVAAMARVLAVDPVFLIAPLILVFVIGSGTLLFRVARSLGSIGVFGITIAGCWILNYWPQITAFYLILLAMSERMRGTRSVCRAVALSAMLVLSYPLLAPVLMLAILVQKKLRVRTLLWASALGALATWPALAGVMANLARTSNPGPDWQALGWIAIGVSLALVSPRLIQELKQGGRKVRPLTALLLSGLVGALALLVSGSDSYFYFKVLLIVPILASVTVSPAPWKTSLILLLMTLAVLKLGYRTGVVADRFESYPEPAGLWRQLIEMRAQPSGLPAPANRIWLIADPYTLAWAQGLALPLRIASPQNGLAWSASMHRHYHRMAIANRYAPEVRPGDQLIWGDSGVVPLLEMRYRYVMVDENPDRAFFRARIEGLK